MVPSNPGTPSSAPPPPELCPHTGEPLIRLDEKSEMGREFSLAPSSGAVYYREARSVEYGSDYFLEEYEKQYGKSYRDDQENLRRMARKRLKEMEPYLSPPARILEIGSALGFFLDEARRNGYEAEGVEISPYASEFSRREMGLFVRTGSFLEREFHSTFHAIAAYYVLEHFRDQKGFFRKIASLLRPGGLFSFAVPSTRGPLFRFHREEWYRTHPADHFADYSPESLEKILPLYGLELLSVRPASYHKERTAGWFSLLPDRLYRLYADAARFGDTMECLARASLTTHPQNGQKATP